MTRHNVLVTIGAYALVIGGWIILARIYASWREMIARKKQQ